MIKRAILFLLASALAGQFVRPQAPQLYGYKVIRSYPHDRGAFTQGLEFKDGILYEATGLKGQSSLRKVKLETGAILAQTALTSEYFGEGITVQANRILQLTWTHGLGFIYDKKTLKRTGSFPYPGEGWGLTQDAKHIYMSDGTSQIRVWDPVSLKELRRISVTLNGRAVDQLNELEMIEGEIWANVWQRDSIVRISPSDGRVTGIVDLSGILPADYVEADVLNGIAYDSIGKRIFVTGKLWPKIFEIQLVKR